MSSNEASNNSVVSFGSFTRCRNVRSKAAANMKHEKGPSEKPAAASTVDSNAAFPAKLRVMLDDADTEGFEHIVSWQPNGKEFKVHDPEAFVAQVMPSYFNQSKYKSFQRQCNLYGFLRILDGPSKGGYAHPAFVRANPLLALSISREKAVSKASSVASVSTSSVHKKKKKSKKFASVAMKQHQLQHIVSPIPPPKREAFAPKAPPAEASIPKKKKRSKKTAPAAPSSSEGSYASARSSNNQPTYQVIPESPRTPNDNEQRATDMIGSGFLPSGDAKISPDAQSSRTSAAREVSVGLEEEDEEDDVIEMLGAGEVMPAGLLDVDELYIDPLFSIFALEDGSDIAATENVRDDSENQLDLDQPMLPDIGGNDAEPGHADSNAPPFIALPRVSLLPRSRVDSSPSRNDVLRASQGTSRSQAGYDQHCPVPISPCGRRDTPEAAPSTPQCINDKPPPCFAPPVPLTRFVPYFAYKLFDMLDHADRYGFRNTISWLDDGRSFAVHDHHDFCTRIMPYYLDGMSHYDAFRRQLDQHGFLAGSPSGSYSHPDFFFGDRSCCELVMPAP